MKRWYKIRQFINGKTVTFNSIYCDYKTYKKIIDFILMPDNNELVEKYRIYKFAIKSENHEKIYFTFAFSPDKTSKDVLKFFKSLEINNIVPVKAYIFYGRIIQAKMPFKGQLFEKYVADFYENQGYKVIRNYEKQKKDDGIDVIAIKNDNLLVIQCKNWYVNYVSHKDLKEFLGNCYLFFYKNADFRKYKVNRIFAITKDTALSKSAQFLVKDSYPFLMIKVFNFHYPTPQKSQA